MAAGTAIIRAGLASRFQISGYNPFSIEGEQGAQKAYAQWLHNSGGLRTKWLLRLGNSRFAILQTARDLSAMPVWRFRIRKDASQALRVINAK